MENNDILIKIIEEKLMREYPQIFMIHGLQEQHPFIMNLIHMADLDVNDFSGHMLLKYIVDRCIFLNYLADAQRIIVKKFFETKYQKEYSDDEIRKKVESLKPLAFHHFMTYPLDTLDYLDRAKIYQDIHMMKELYDRGIPDNTEYLRELIECLSNYQLIGLANKFSAIVNIQQDNLCHELGIQEYLKQYIEQILSFRKSNLQLLFDRQVLDISMSVDYKKVKKL